MAWLWAIWTFFFQISSSFHSFLKEFIMAFLFVLSSNKVNIFYHILKLEKKYRFIPKGILLLFFLLKWNCSYSIPECLLLEWFFFNHSKPLTQCTSLSSPRVSLPKPAGVIPEATMQWWQTAYQCPLPPEKGSKAWWAKVLMALYHSVWMEEGGLCL